MSLLERALQYRKSILDRQGNSKHGLLNRALEILNEENRDENFFGEELGSNLSFEDNDDSDDIDEISNQADLVLPTSLDSHKSSYCEIINEISNDMSVLSLEKNAYVKFDDIISEHLNFNKSALLIYSPKENKFICWHGKNMDMESIKKLSLDLNFNNIYKRMITEKSILVTKNDDDFYEISELLSNKDMAEVKFQLYIPFIFSAHVIGIFLGFKLNDSDYPDEEMIEGLEMLGRLNGALLYNIYQQENILSQKKKGQPDFEVDSELSEVSDERIQILVFYTKENINRRPDFPLSIIYFQILNIEENEKRIPGLKVLNLINDVQFVIMNIIGTNGHVKILSDMSAYIILPEAKKFIAEELAKEIRKEITALFVEINKEINLSLQHKVANYPEDSTNPVALFNEVTALS